MLTGLASPTHLIIVLVIFLLLFGAKRVPELGKGLGSGIMNFKAGLSNPVEEPEKERLEAVKENN